MNWIKAIATVLVLWSSPAWSATLTWTANNEPDLAGYRIYQCNQQPCTPVSGNASVLATLGTATSFNIGTPAVTQYYFITAIDFSNNESSASNVATYTPAGAPPPVVPPAIGASPTSLSFAATQGGANPATQAVSISNTGGGTLSWTASDNAPWLTVSTASGTGNGAVTLSVTTGTLTAGSYSAAVTISATGASSVTVPVTFTVGTAPVPPTIGASPTSLSFAATQGGANPATQAVSISNTGGGTLSWTASDNAPWLTVSTASGTGNGAVTLSVTTGTLTAGSYSAAVTISATGASSVTVPVTFTVGTAPVPPAIGASPTSLSFAATQGGANPATQTVSISNTGGGTLSWTASDNAPWLTLLTLLGQASGIGNGVVTVSVATGSMAVGSYTGSITISAIGASSVTVPVTFTVGTAPVPPPVHHRWQRHR